MPNPLLRRRAYFDSLWTQLLEKYRPLGSYTLALVLENKRFENFHSEKSYWIEFFVQFVLPSKKHAAPLH